MAYMRTSAASGETPLLQLKLKGNKFVTCPACRHGGTTVKAKEWLSRRRYAAGMAIVIVFAPLTLGVLLVLVPMLFEPQSVTHSCRRCGLRLAIARIAPLEYGYTIPVDVDDDHFVPAPDDWRPDLARLPGGMRVAKSPISAPTEVSERELKDFAMRFASRRPLRKLTLLSDNAMDHTVRCVLDDDGDVLYRLHASNVRAIASLTAPDACIKVEMRSPPADSEADQLPAYTKKPTDATTITSHEPSVSSLSAQVFTQACRFHLFSNKTRKYSTVMYSPSISGTSETSYLNPVPARYRSFFWGDKPIWRWQSSQGALLWMSRRYRDADMSALQTRLCLLDDYDQLLAVLDGWDGLSLMCAVDGAYSIKGSGPNPKSTLVLYADLDAQLLGEILGSLGAMAVQVNRVTTELKREADERRSKIQ